MPLTNLVSVPSLLHLCPGERATPDLPLVALAHHLIPSKPPDPQRARQADTPLPEINAVAQGPA
ncbi:MAG: hypothetical protein OXI35_16805 [Gemmatimonadota bacterium]|nr:hypothetical protein [Gemmatimonadota bacterium]